MTNAADCIDPYLIYGENIKNGCRLVFSDEKEIVYEQSLEDVLNEICLKHGSSLSGRTASFRYMSGNVYKACILIDERSGHILIPSGSFSTPHTAVVLYNDIEKMKTIGQKCTRLIMKNSMRIDFGLSLRSLRTQCERCQTYLAKIDEQMLCTYDTMHTRLI